MIGLKEVESIHDVLIEKFGGLKGTRDTSVLESALNRPYQTFDKQELYPDPVDKAAALFESIVSNHPFVDGNKRTAWVLMRLMLLEYNHDIKATQEDKYNFVISAASGEIRFDKIRQWISEHTISL